jgi:hypothetical protein
VVVADAIEGGERVSGTSDVKKRGGVSMIDERRCGNKSTVSLEGTRPARDRGIIADCVILAHGLHEDLYLNIKIFKF